MDISVPARILATLQPSVHYQSHFCFLLEYHKRQLDDVVVRRIAALVRVASSTRFAFARLPEVDVFSRLRRGCWVTQLQARAQGAGHECEAKALNKRRLARADSQTGMMLIAGQLCAHGRDALISLLGGLAATCGTHVRIERGYTYDARRSRGAVAACERRAGHGRSSLADPDR